MSALDHDDPMRAENNPERNRVVPNRGSLAVVSGSIVDPPYPRALTSPATPQDMLRIAIDTGATVEQMKELWLLQKDWEADQARKAYFASLAGFKAESVEIVKRKLVEFTTRDGDTTSYVHAELADCTAAIAPALARHQLGFRWDVQQAGGQITVVCILTHALGHSEQVQLQAAPDGSGKKNAIQQVASTITYLQRYTLLAITGCATKGEDDDDGRGAGDGHGAFDDPTPDAGGERDPFFISEEQEIKLRDLIEGHGVDEKKLLQYLKREKLSHIPATWYDRTVAAIKSKAQQS